MTDPVRFTAEVQDLAREWTNDNHPDAKGYEWIALFVSACVEFADLREEETRLTAAFDTPRGGTR